MSNVGWVEALAETQRNEGSVCWVYQPSLQTTTPMKLFAKLPPMRTYKRLQITGGCYFFTVNLAQRQDNNLLVRHIDNLRAAFKQIRSSHPFEIDAIVILPEHLHCLWQLPADDKDYSTRWRLIRVYSVNQFA